MLLPRTIEAPHLVRIKPGVLGRVGTYLNRFGLQRPTMLTSSGLPTELVRAARSGLAGTPIEVVSTSTEDIEPLKHDAVAARSDVIVGLGGGKALDVAKWIAAELRLPYVAVPLSVATDAFASPMASLMVAGRRRSVRARMAFGVLIDTEVCADAPPALWLSGIGDLVAKLTAVQDWKLAYHARGTAVDDMAAMLSDASVYQLLARPTRDSDGVRRLATALLLNGVAMQIAGSSRPASGSEHLVSHALDQIASAPHMHGIQVGLATYVVSRLQAATDMPRRDGSGPAIVREFAEATTLRIVELFEAVGFWAHLRAAPLRRDEFLRAVALARSVKDDFYTVLDTRDCLPEVERMLNDDPHLSGCVIGRGP